MTQVHVDPPLALREADRLMHVLGQMTCSGSSSDFPAYAIFENAREMAICVHLPGVTLADLNVIVTHEAIELSGEHPRGAFDRVIHLPDEAIEEMAEMTLRHDLLAIRIPLAPKARPSDRGDKRVSSHDPDDRASASTSR